MADAVVERAPEQAQGRDAQGPAPADSAAKRRRALTIIGGVAAVVILGVLLYLLLTAGKESTDDANVDADVVPLAPHVAGQVAAVPVTENQSVKKGEVVLQIDDRDYQARVAQAAAELDSVRAQAQAADAQAAVAEASARGGLTQAQANLIGTQPLGVGCPRPARAGPGHAGQPAGRSEARRVQHRPRKRAAEGERHSPAAGRPGAGPVHLRPGRSQRGKGGGGRRVGPAPPLAGPGQRGRGPGGGEPAGGRQHRGGAGQRRLPARPGPELGGEPGAGQPQPRVDAHPRPGRRDGEPASPRTPVRCSASARRSPSSCR